MSRIKWYGWDDTVYPQCTWCGNYPLQPQGRDEQGYYLLQCGTCGRVFAHKTPLSVLRKRAKARRW